MTLKSKSFSAFAGRKTAKLDNHTVFKSNLFAWLAGCLFFLFKLGGLYGHLVTERIFGGVQNEAVVIIAKHFNLNKLNVTWLTNFTPPFM